MKPADRKSFLAQWGGEPPRPTDLAWWTLAGACILGLSVVFNRFGMLHFEWWYYVPFHLGPGSIWAKIFDSRTLDQGVYAGRELSYLIDHVDLLAVAASVEWGYPVFVSVTHLVLAVFMGVWLGWFAARDLKLGSLVGLLLALLLWTTPYFYIHFLMRTAKGLTAAGVLVLAVEIFRALRAGPAGLTARRMGVIALAALVMSFADRQGFYLLLCALALTGLQAAWARSPVAGRISVVLAGVLGIELVYFFWVAPALTRAFWHYAPDFSFNSLPWPELAAAPGFFAVDATRALLETTSFTLGGVPLSVAALALLAMIAVPLARDVRTSAWRRQVPLSAVLAGMIAALWLMNALMILRHPRIRWADMMTVYYWIPTTVLLGLGLAGSAGDWLAAVRARRVAFAGLLLALVAGNIAMLPRHRRVFESGHLHDSVVNSEEMLYALRHRDAPAYLAPESIEHIPAYQTLLARAPRAGVTAPWDEFFFGGFYRATRAPGAAPRFLEQLGGNLDSRFLATDARFEPAADGRAFVGTRAGSAWMRFNRVSNRLQGEVIVRRAGPEAAAPVAVEFVIYASPDDRQRYERWRQRVELPAGQTEVRVPYAIDCSHLPVLFTLDVPAASVGAVVAGWLMPTITDVGGDSATPVWFSGPGGPATLLDEAALAQLLPGAWRPVAAQLRGGRVTAGGIVLPPGGEIWLKVNGIVSRFAGRATNQAAPGAGPPATVRALWYKAGRMHSYQAPSPPDAATGNQTFQAWCGEPGGWLVIAADPTPGLQPVLVRVEDVRQE